MKRRFAEFETWQIFVSLMRLGSMSRVGKETGYETSFVSRRIAALEKSVASKLFERTTRLCMPTHEAHALRDRILPYVVDLERRLEMASRAVKATSGDVVLKVRYASGLLPFVVRAIKPFRDNHPEYKFEVSAVHTPPVGSVMDADLGIWASSGTSPHFTFEDLGVVPSWLCATPSFLERHSVRTVEDLDKVPLLGCSHWIAPFLIVPAVDPLLPNGGQLQQRAGTSRRGTRRHGGRRLPSRLHGRDRHRQGPHGPRPSRTHRPVPQVPTRAPEDRHPRS